MRPQISENARRPLRRGRSDLRPGAGEGRGDVDAVDGEDAQAAPEPCLGGRAALPHLEHDRLAFDLEQDDSGGRRLLLAPVARLLRRQDAGVQIPQLAEHRPKHAVERVVVARGEGQRPMSGRDRVPSRHR